MKKTPLAGLLAKRVSGAIIRLISLFFFLHKHCWRLSVKKANALGYGQISDSTEANRYPEIFAYVRHLTSADEQAAILSYGCSYGLECHSLRGYFPQAAITGYDIFAKNISRAKKANTDAKIYFTAQVQEAAAASYDIIFAMSVLCRTPHTYAKNDCSQIYSFSQFDNQVALCDTLLKSGGLLVIYNANFRFTDTAVSRHYKAIAIPDFTDSGIVPKFDTNNKLLDDQNYRWTIFRKICT